jgi:SAM-dependent methyltransferase
MEPELRRMTEEVAKHPRSWSTFRDEVKAEFDRSADVYESRLGPDHLAPLAAALGRVEAPGRALDVGCGTGVAADLVAAMFPSTLVCAVDISERMVRVGDAKERMHPVRFLVADAATLPFADSTFDLVALVAVPVFAAQLARVLTDGGTAAATFPLGEATPIFLSESELTRVFRSAGFGDIEHGASGRGTWTLAKRPGSTPMRRSSRRHPRRGRAPEDGLREGGRTSKA